MYVTTNPDLIWFWFDHMSFYWRGSEQTVSKLSDSLLNCVLLNGRDECLGSRFHRKPGEPVRPARPSFHPCSVNRACVNSVSALSIKTQCLSHCRTRRVSICHSLVVLPTFFHHRLEVTWTVSESRWELRWGVHALVIYVVEDFIWSLWCSGS